MANSASTTYRAGVHRLAGATVATTLLLIFVGGVVTNTGSALAVPDWPTTYGYNMFLYPPSMMVGGIFYEHSHRLLGSLVGMLTVALALWIWRAEERVWVRRMAAAAVVGVILQGVLGGMRVLFQAGKIAIVHGCLAQAFLSLMVGLTVATSRWWYDAEAVSDADEALALRNRAFFAAASFYLQIVAGSLVTHTGGRLDLHLLIGGVATISALLVAARAVANTSPTGGLHRLSYFLLGLLSLQLVLGFGAMLVRFAEPGEQFPIAVALALPTLHRVTGACLVATAMALAWRVARATRFGAEADHSITPSLTTTESRAGVAA